MAGTSNESPADLVEPAPPVPPGVPEDAHYVPRSATWQHGEVDGEGRAHGKHHVYRGDGTLASELNYEHGQLDGAFRRFHPNGQVARLGRFTAGQLQGEVLAFASADPSPETLRSCCVPNGAAKMVAHYQDGRCRSEIFYDAQDRRLLDDGSLHPDHPGSVPARAQYSRHDGRWAVGSSDSKGRQGRWQWWWRDGTLAEIATFQNGKPHGTQERFDERGLSTSLMSYEAGVRQGPSRERIPPGTYADARIVVRQGRYERGFVAGEWTYLDDRGEVLARIDWGHPPLTIAPEEASLATLDAVSDNSPIRLQAAIGEKLVTDIRKDNSPLPDKLARLWNLLHRGVRPARVIVELAGHLVVAPQMGLSFARRALELEPDNADALALVVLNCLEAGRVEEARPWLEQLTKMAPAAATHLEQSQRVLYPNFVYLPLTTPLDDRTAAELPQRVAQPLSSLRSVIAKSARRLAEIRDALVTRVGSTPDWLPPDTNALWQSHPEELLAYEFVIEGDGIADTVLVREAVDLGSQEVTEMMRSARVEWQMLCWLCFCAGLDEVALPETMRPQPLYPRALATAFTRHYRASDQLQTAGLRSRMQKVPNFDWEGMSISSLKSRFARMALAEMTEMRAALFFAGDPECRSPWQDDLRG